MATAGWNTVQDWDGPHWCRETHPIAIPMKLLASSRKKFPMLVKAQNSIEFPQQPWGNTLYHVPFSTIFLVKSS